MYNSSANSTSFFPIKRALQLHGSHARKKDIPALFEFLGAEFASLKKRIATLEEKQEDRYEMLDTALARLS